MTPHDHRGMVQVGFLAGDTAAELEMLVAYAETRGMTFVWGDSQSGDALGWPAEADRFREALVQCATEAGEDVSGGPPSWPDVADWAVQAVRECRKDAEDGYDALERERGRYRRGLEFIASAGKADAVTEAFAEDVLDLAQEDPTRALCEGGESQDD